MHSNTLEAEHVSMHNVLRLVINQSNGIFEAKEEKMKKYLAKIKELATKFKTFKITQITLTNNAHVDALATLSSIVSKNMKGIM